MPRAIPTRLDFHQFPLRREFWENSEANLSPPALVFIPGEWRYSDPAPQVDPNTDFSMLRDREQGAVA